MQNVKISIILPCYNVAQYIERSIKSILSQSFTDYEIIVINDGSKDNLEDICKQWSELPNFFFFTFPNQGLSQARNEGIAKSSGEYLYFFDPDDTIEPDALQTAYEICNRTNSDAVQFAYRSIVESTGKESWVRLGNKQKTVYEGADIINELLPRFIGFSAESLCHYGTPEFRESIEMNSVWRFLYKRSVISDNNIAFPVGVKMVEDKIFNSYFFLYASKIVIIKDVLYNYYLKDGGLMYSSLNNPFSLIKDKIDGVVERGKIRKLYKSVRNEEIGHLYIGSLILSSFELIVKLGTVKYTDGLKGIYRYLSLDEVKNAFKVTSGRNFPLKVKLPFLFVKYHLTAFLYTGLWLGNKLGVKLKF